VCCILFPQQLQQHGEPAHRVATSHDDVVVLRLTQHVNGLAQELGLDVRVLCEEIGECIDAELVRSHGRNGLDGIDVEAVLREAEQIAGEQERGDAASATRQIRALPSVPPVTTRRRSGLNAPARIGAPCRSTTVCCGRPTRSTRAVPSRLVVSTRVSRRLKDTLVTAARCLTVFSSRHPRTRQMRAVPSPSALAASLPSWLKTAARTWLRCWLSSRSSGSVPGSQILAVPSRLAVTTRSPESA